MEQWVEIRGFPQYSVSNLGRVQNVVTERIMRPTTNHRNVLIVQLRKDGKYHCRTVSRLVLDAFKPQPDTDATPIHLDGDSKNNAIYNLEWKSRWFALALKRQQSRKGPLDRRPVFHVSSQTRFTNALSCAEYFGDLEETVLDVARSAGSMLFRGSEIHFCK